MASDVLMDELVMCTFEVAAVLTRAGAECDLSLTQLRALGILRDRRVRMTDLAARLGLEKSTMSGLVDRAERRGLVARGRNAEDGRVVDVYITPAGLELATRLYSEIRRALAPMIDRLAPGQQDQLARLLAAMDGAASRTDPIRASGR